MPPREHGRHAPIRLDIGTTRHFIKCVATCASCWRTAPAPPVWRVPFSSTSSRRRGRRGADRGCRRRRLETAAGCGCLRRPPARGRLSFLSPSSTWTPRWYAIPKIWMDRGRGRCRLAIPGNAEAVRKTCSCAATVRGASRPNCRSRSGTGYRRFPETRPQMGGCRSIEVAEYPDGKIELWAASGCLAPQRWRADLDKREAANRA
jgi:hypothetical protein